MKKKLLLMATILAASVSAMAQRSYTFNVAAYNVDGLPVTMSILGVEIQTNEGGGEGEGATEMGNQLKGESWDIVGLSEDFNFHNQLVAPLTDYYHVASHGGTVTSSIPNSTDGLGLLVAKRGTYPNFSNETRVKWSTSYGNTDNGSDGLITKGFRYYLVTLAEGIQVDVYVLHMDAGTAEEDGDYENGIDKNIIARETQLKQLRDYIVSHNYGRHIFVIGDWNCRYTRENLKSIFIDGIHNADNTLTARDVWVECVWGGKYPTYGGDAMMVYDNSYGYQKGEVVDKIIYIENSKSSLKIKANSYLQDTTFPVTDHYPALGNFTITDPSGESVNDWSVEVDSKYVNADFTLDGEELVAGNTYYIMNLETKKYIKPSAKYGVQAILGSAGHPVTIEADGDNYILKSRLGHFTTDTNPYMDNGTKFYYTLELVPGTEYQYYIKCSNGTLTGNGENALLSISNHTGDDNQKWLLMTDDRIKSEMVSAGAAGLDITPLIKDADFDVKAYNGTWNNYAYNWTNFESAAWAVAGSWDPQAVSDYWSLAFYQSKAEATTISQSLTNMPVGKYKLTYNGLYRYTETKKPVIGSTTTTDKTMAATVTLGSTSKNIDQNTSVGIGDTGAAATEFKNGNNDGEIEVTTSSAGQLDVKVSKPATDQGETSSWGTKYTRDSWVVIDNFRLTYYGAEVSEEDIKGATKADLGTYINNAWAEVQAMGPEAMAAFDLSTLVYRYENNLLSSDGEDEKNIVDAAVAIAEAAANAAAIEDAINNGDGDVTSFITNPSFETGNLTGWTIAGGGWDVAVQPNSNATYTTNDCDGDYLFNSYGGDNGLTAHIEQTITGVTNGLYELKALVTSFGPDEGGIPSDSKGNTVYLIGNSYHKGVIADTKTQFKEATLYFLVEDGTAKIGAVGGHHGYYHPNSGCFFKADNFRLKYICDAPHGRVKLALDEANAAKLDKYGQAALDLSAYEAAYANKTITGDGSAEVAAIYAALQAAAKAQKTAGADMTYAITNPNFETGTIEGWTCATGGDTKAAPQENGTYTSVGVDGRYMLNTWDNNAAKTLTQTVSGLPAGYYRLEAMLSTEANSSVTLSNAGSTIYKSTITTLAHDTLAHKLGYGSVKEMMMPATVEKFPANTGSVTITVVGSATASATEGVWFKADNFRLTYLGRHTDLFENLYADEVDEYNNGYYTSATLKRTISRDKWHTFVVPFSVEGETFDSLKNAGWEVKQLESAVLNGDNVSLRFSDASTISAGVPYMVRTSSDVTSLNMSNIDIDMSVVNPQKVDYVTFTGTYSSGNVPQGAFFISNNTFYQAADGTNTTKGYRGWFVPEAANIKALGYSFDDIDFTGIEGVEDNAAEIIAIYGADGTLRSDLQKGINIVKMSNGTTKKVLVP